MFSGNDDTPGSDSNFETCLISNADLAALTSTPPSASDGIKMEPLKDHQVIYSDRKDSFFHENDILRK